ncbi:hypothetical protein O181_095127 [Austropuccinia psidii MF-1]|uniref:Uncharacterized protein n=1 Tax=Austropuccinia psidii MF-1 TaxID=1389203 RepID=A0A9Q3PC68_9BASI|nr:hypothetical protein [Austropuccinia psidii MF-1]
MQSLRLRDCCWQLNFACLLPLLIISGLVTCNSVSLYQSMNQVQAGYHRLIENLQQASTTFDPKTYTRITLFQIMLSSDSLSKVKKILIASVNDLNWIFLIGHIALIICYLPILIVSLRDLEQKAKVFTINLVVPGNVTDEEWTTVCMLVKKSKATLTFRSWAIFLEQIFWLPSLLWYRLGLRRGEAFIEDRNFFWIGRLVTLTLPMTSLNFNLSILAIFAKDNFLKTEAATGNRSEICSM